MKQEKENYLGFKDIMNFIKEMSYSTGLYGRLYNAIMETKESQEEFKRIVNEQKFTDTLDFVMWFEC